MTALTALETSMLAETLAQLNADPTYLQEYREMCSESYKDFNGMRGRHMFGWTAEELVAWWGQNYKWQATPGNEDYAPHYGYWTWRDEEMNAADTNYFATMEYYAALEAEEAASYAAWVAEREAAAAEEAAEQFFFDCERHYGYRVRA